ncbi:MAG TPA: bifunctional (p)ppGpp synthetase/guanosine-3',5'-bis(diphosphate) 3'-pyrophosphohydrolase, partial [Candidatus Limnocylindria bacterium]|nr:bifunctional (p)ppGpp synthetase/guanosine-3',5'-bis(diphosphate) 3'-pyrophosphohydrolase [Candidatus Limnocylindria bacterium]
MDLARLRAAPAAVVSRISRTQAPAEPTHSIEDVVAEARLHRPSINVGLIERAHQVAADAHEEQLRASGVPYVQHPVEVAYYLATLQMDAETLAAGLLHDVPEDTDMTIQDIEKRFGREVARLVDGVTKLSKFGSARTMEEQQAENIRKMFMAMAEDVRVVIIKLADRLHNMRTLGFLPPEKQTRIARQTMEIYAPLAHRLGMWQIKWELEDLSFKYIAPDKYRQLVEMLADRRKARESFINKSIQILRRELAKMSISAEISGRPKHLYSIYKKMERKGAEFNEIYDLHAIRVLVEDVKDCYAALGVVHSMWRPIPGQFDDYIAMPKANMYQSLHTAVIGPDAKPLEVQIRTRQMHDVAEAGIAAHWRYKEGSRGDRRYDEKLAWVRQLIDWQREVSDATEFVEGLKLEVFQDQVFVFTPKGDVKDLPNGATPLDFAYRIHTDVGHRTIGAKVNNRLVPLDYKLRNGDIVEIITTKAAHGPSRDWLNIVQTSAAREKIRQWFKRQQRDENIAQGRELLDRELRRVAHETLGSVPAEKLTEIAAQSHYREMDDFFAAIGYGAVSPGSVVSKLEIHDDAAITLPEVAPPNVKSSTTGVRVKGVGDLLVRF